MTDKQLAMVKRLSEKYGILAESLDKTLLLLGVGYGLQEEQIEEYLTIGEGKLMEKHMKMLRLVLEIGKSDTDNDWDGDEITGVSGVYQKERLSQMLQEHYCVKSKRKGKKSYEKLAQYILNSTDLSAAQIEQLRLAASAGMPEGDVMALARTGKESMEIRRCVEFYEMVHDKKVKRRGVFSKFD